MLDNCVCALVCYSGAAVSVYTATESRALHCTQRAASAESARHFVDAMRSDCSLSIHIENKRARRKVSCDFHCVCAPLGRARASEFRNLRAFGALSVSQSSRVAKCVCVCVCERK